MGMKGKTFKSVFSACTSIVALSICLTAGAVQGTGTVDAVGGLNLRSGQSTTSGKITVLPNEAKIQINYEDNGWYNVTYAGLTGFVKQEYVKVDGTSQQEAQAVEETMQNATAVQSGETQYRVVNAEGGLRLRGTPDTNGQILATMPNNSRIQFIVRDGEWAQVIYNGMEGYCSATYLRMDDVQTSTPVQQPETDTLQSGTGVAGYVTISGGLRLRSTGSTNAEIVATMPQYAAITILDDSTGWAKVSYQGQVGYCSKQYIAYGSAPDVMDQDDEQEQTSSTTVTTEQATVSASGGLNLRSEASTNGESLTVIPDGSSVVITSTRDDGWSEVVYGNLTGYVSNDYLINFQSGTNQETSSQPKTKGDEVVECAKQFLGVPYVYGGTSPAGFDCSGLTYYVYKQFGVTLNRTSSAQALNGTSVDKSDLQPGDLVFFCSNGSSTIGHVGIYVGNNQFIHAPQTGDVVKISSLSSVSYSLRYVGARRIFN